MTTLTEIANNLGCDKGTMWFEKHGYTEIYENVIGPQSYMLEIGVDKGLSVLLWKQWSNSINLIAIDNNPACISAIVTALCDARLCDQSNRDQLFELAQSIGCGVLDVIVDDGSHKPDDQMLTLESLWQCLKPGGMYFVEDLHTSEWFPLEARAPKRVQQFAEQNGASVKFVCNDKLAWIVKR